MLRYRLLLGIGSGQGCRPSPWDFPRPVLSYSGRVLGVVEVSIVEDSAGNLMQLANFARNARVASLLLPSQLSLPRLPAPATREEAVARAMKAVCQVKVQ